MSDSDSMSIGSEDNVMVNLGFPTLAHFRHHGSHEIESSSESGDDPFLLLGSDSRSSHSDAELDNSSERSNSIRSVSSCSSISSHFGSHTDVLNSNSRPITTQKHNRWFTPKELYNREIGSYKNSILWNTKFCQSLVAVQKLKLSKQLRGHRGCVNSLDFNTAGDLMASGSDDCRIGLWNWSEGKCMIMYNSRHTRNIFQTKFLTTQGDILIVSSGRDGLVMLTAGNNCDIIYSKVIARHSNSSNKLGVHRDTPYVILSCGDDGIVKNIDIREGPIEENNMNTDILRVISPRGIPMQIYGIDINPFNPSEFIINGNDESVKMYDKRRLSGPLKEFCRQLNNLSQETSIDDGYSDNVGEEHIEIRGDMISLANTPRIQRSNITSAVYNYCGTEILASYSDDDIYLFDVNGSSDTHLNSYSGHLNNMTVKGVNFYGPRSDYVVSGSDCGHIFMWDKKTEAIVQRKHADAKGAVNVLEAHPHVATLATSGIDKTIKIWEPLNNWKQPSRSKLRTSVITSRAQRDQSPNFRLLGNSNVRMNVRNITYELRRFF